MADSGQEMLLRVQEHDTKLDQLRHRRSALPERAELMAKEEQLARMETELEVVRARHAELERSQRRLEDEVTSLDSKATEVDRKLYSGTVANPRELQAMQDEIRSLRRRQSSLEDDLLDVMEQMDPVTAEMESLRERQRAVEEDADRIREVITAAEAEIDAEAERTSAARSEAAGEVPPSLLETYETLRPKLGGIAVARLEGNRCGGCHLTLPATEVDQIKRQPPDALVRHEECGRILVR